uniref:Uncharacterized protein n=1 Tax=Rhipicephalus microplus TaxID=6941 RepID=A0A6G5AFL0_RHIMP
MEQIHLSMINGPILLRKLVHDRHVSFYAFPKKFKFGPIGLFIIATYGKMGYYYFSLKGCCDSVVRTGPPQNSQVVYHPCSGHVYRDIGLRAHYIVQNSVN